MSHDPHTLAWPAFYSYLLTCIRWCPLYPLRALFPGASWRSVVPKIYSFPCALLRSFSHVALSSSRLPCDNGTRVRLLKMCNIKRHQSIVHIHCGGDDRFPPPRTPNHKAHNVHVPQYSGMIVCPTHFPDVIRIVFCISLQLQNKGEQGGKTYAEAVPWLEMAMFGGFLADREVRVRVLLTMTLKLPRSCPLQGPRAKSVMSFTAYETCHEAEALGSVGRPEFYFSPCRTSGPRTISCRRSGIFPRTAVGAQKTTPRQNK